MMLGMPTSEQSRRIMILGYSGSGKSTLATQLGSAIGAPVLHLDTVHWLPDWKERTDQDAEKIVNDFLDTHESWVIDGNYHAMAFQRRLDSADRILILNVNRFTCLYRAVRRWLQYRHSSRPDMTEGCNEKIDAEFLWWLLWKGRSQERARQYQSIARQHASTCQIVSDSHTMHMN